MFSVTTLSDALCITIQFLELSGQSCLVVGAGAVGCRKIASLLECPIERLHVIDLAEPDTNLQCC
ncbi:MAG: NAD(P)-dependent oxidoreductase [Bilophila wadsworthia]